MTCVRLALLAPSGSRLVAKTRRCQRRDRGFESRLPLQVSKYVRGGVAKTARHLPAKEIIGSAILPTASRLARRSFCAGVAQWEELGPRKSVIGVRIAAPAPKVCWSSTMGVQRACTSPTSVLFTRPAPSFMAGLAEWLRHWIVAPVTRVRFSHLAPSGRFV